MPTIVVRDYNILSNFSDNAEKLSNCAKEHVNADTRFDLIQKRIERLVEEKAIICLQEVPQVWGNRLLTYFYQNDYFFIPSYYSNYVSGRMGVGIAFPRSLYNLEESHIITLSDTKKWPSPEIKNTTNLIANLFTKLKLLFLSFFIKPKVETKQEDVWSLARARVNTTICLKLSVIGEENAKFCISTYHMPCLFKYPAVMMIHCHLLAKYVQNIAQSTPYIITGDFNFTPSSTCYKYYTSGTVDENSPDCPVPYPSDDDFDLSSIAPMKSAYHQMLGREPEFTIRAGTQPPFIDTLDYIFYSSNITPIEVLALPKEETFTPNAQEPSDHLMIGATFDLITKQ